MTASAAETIEALIETITTWPVGMPVRAMEQVLARGAAAAPAVREALARWADDPDRDALWLVVLLGELRDPETVGPLADLLRSDNTELPLAAVEALVKIGPPALPALLEAARAPEPVVRVYGYAGLGWTPDDQGYATLVAALAADPELADAAAMALADLGRAEAIPALYEAYRRGPAWQRIELEDALRHLHWRRQEPPPWARDWRLRCRRDPRTGVIPTSWAWVAAVMLGHAERKAERVTIPLRALEEIVSEPPEPDEPPETCEECGAPVERPTGLPVCPETALPIAMRQHDFLGQARDDGIDDLFVLLDDLDDWLWELLDGEEGAAFTAGEKTAREETADEETADEETADERDDIRFRRETCEWLIGQGIEDVSAARARLLAEAGRLAHRHGDPHRFFITPPVVLGPRPGRNDPCPCGSGRKYKRCCLDRDRGAPPPGPPAPGGARAPA
jgi:hypothetical protein